MNNPSLVIDPSSEIPSELTITGKEEDLKNFIKSLLGRPQELTRTIVGFFEITKTELVHVHHALSQRIQQQNRAHLLQFSARMVFNDNSTVLINSFEEFEAYNEIRPVISTEVHLIWDYLIIFQDKKKPEKQQIELSVITSKSAQKPVSKTVLSLDEERPGIFDIHPNRFDIRISHTARTWDADIEALLANLTRNMLKPPDRTKNSCVIMPVK